MVLPWLPSSQMVSNRDGLRLIKNAQRVQSPSETKVVLCMQGNNTMTTTTTTTDDDDDDDDDD